MSDYIPPEVMLEILLRLPSKSLVRFRCVCKSWKSLISSPEFISMHLHFTTTSRNNDSPLLIRHYSRIHGKEIFTLHSEGMISSFHKPQLLDFSLLSCRGFFDMVGSSNGIVCLTDAQLVEPVILWNPSLGVSLTISGRHSFNRRFGFDTIVGFGFDSKNMDYKVVKIASPLGNPGYPEVSMVVKLYKLSVGSWRSLTAMKTPNYVVSNRSPQAIVNGAIHWIGVSRPIGERIVRPKLVVAVFDLGDEVFRELELPEELASEGVNDVKLSLALSVFGKSLSVILYYRDSENRNLYAGCHIWVMEEYGLVESWIKLYTINPLGGLGKALGRRKNGEILLVTSCGELVSYDHGSQRINRLEIYGDAFSFYVDTYVESLVLWKAENGVGREASSSNAITLLERASDLPMVWRNNCSTIMGGILENG